MAKQLKLRRGTTTQHSTFTGASGEVTVDTTKKTLVVHDGVTAGGVPLVPVTDVSTNGGNSKILRTDSSGNLGLGVTPSAWSIYKAFQFGGTGAVSEASGTVQLSANYYRASGGDVYLTSNYATLYRQVSGSGQHQWFNAPSGTAGNAISFTQAMTLDASGNLGVGTTSPARRLDVRGGTGIQVNEDGSGTKVITIRSDFAGVDPAINVTTNNALLLMTNNTERARIDTSGNLLVGQTSGSQRISVTSAVDAYATNINALKSGNTNYYMMLIRANGATVGEIYSNGSTTTYATSSDYRLKEISGGLTGYKERIMALQPKQGVWKSTGLDFRGFLAHEFAESYPSLVNGEKDAVDADGNPLYQSMEASGSETIADLVAFVQEQQAIIEGLTARISALEAPQGGL